MKPPANRRAEALVLRRTAYGDADWIVTLFSREEGLVRAVAKNARASRKRFGGALDLFSRVRIDTKAPVHGRSEALWRLESAELLDAHLSLRSSLEALEAASHACRAVGALLHEHEPSAALFENLCLFLSGTGRSGEGEVPAELARLWALLRVLDAAGFAPLLGECVRCGRTLGEHRSAAFSAAEGGLVCGECQHGEGAQVLPPAGVRVLREIASVTFGELPSVRITPRGRAQLLRLVSDFLDYRAGKSLRGRRRASNV
ncbi:MAG: DNA repair protein RecO [Bdellovibrionota bacterium]